MNKIILSINPEYANQIIEGKKRYEFRRIIAKKEIHIIVIYSTSPVKKVLGEAKVREVIKENPNDLWEYTKDYGGITKEDYDEYFLGRNTAYAYVLEEVYVFDTPKELSDYGIDFAPQSFVYI